MLVIFLSPGLVGRSKTSFLHVFIAIGGTTDEGGKGIDRPERVMSSHMAQAIKVGLATIRREIKRLETEEREIREVLLNGFRDWPPEAVPVRVGEVELRIQRR